MFSVEEVIAVLLDSIVSLSISEKVEVAIAHFCPGMFLVLYVLILCSVRKQLKVSTYFFYKIFLL